MTEPVRALNGGQGTDRRPGMSEGAAPGCSVTIPGDPMLSSLVNKRGAGNTTGLSLSLSLSWVLISSLKDKALIIIIRAGRAIGIVFPQDWS